MALTLGEREKQIRALNEELLNLMNYFTEVMRENSGILELHYMSCTSSNMHAMVALLMEEKSASYSRLASEIYEKAKERENNVKIASVKSAILYVGQRSSYGVPSHEADVLEDETQASLWCWETRDMKLLPKSMRGSLKVRRTCRKKIGERITAIHAMLQLLQTPSDCQNYRNDFRKASEKLSKALNESNIRMLVERSKINGSERTVIETKKEEKALAKQLKRKRYEEEKEKKKMDRELLKETLQREKEMKRLQEEAEKEEKQLKRKRDETERDQRRREKEETEQKKRRSLQKQASIMERFLHKNKCPQSENDAIPSVRLSRQEKMHESVTVLMDSALLQKEQITIEEVRKSHLNSWHHLGNSIKSRSGQHWGLRRKPKTALVKDLRLSCSNGTKQEEELNNDSMVGGWSEPALDDQACNSNINFAIQKCRRTKQLLQFDKSYRPAFYGVWPKMSNIVGPRNPYKMDPELDYDVDSDEEWEEEEPGESLSECDKDEEEILGEGLSIAEDGEESEDGFFVPDGYLSENEGVQSNRSPCRVEQDEAATSSRNELEPESEHFSSWVLQIKHLEKLTELALKKNQPLIVTNMKHERANLLCSDNLTGSAKMEHICLQALAMRFLPHGFTVEVHSDDILIQEDQEAFVSTAKSKSLLIPDSELPEIVDTIQSCPYGMKKLLEILLKKFPNCSKSQLKSKVRQISDFVDNKWQVKKEILDQLGLSKSPENSGSKMKSISTYFSKRCTLPSENAAVPIKSSAESSRELHINQLPK